MLPYALLYFPLLLLSFLNLFREFNKKKIVIFILSIYTIILTLFSGLRYNTGFDFYPYQRIFNNIGSRAIFNTSIEPSFVILNKIIYKYFNSFNILLIVLSAICIIFIVKFIKKYSHYKIISLYFYGVIY